MMNNVKVMVVAMNLFRFNYAVMIGPTTAMAVIVMLRLKKESLNIYQLVVKNLIQCKMGELKRLGVDWYRKKNLA